MTEEFLHYIWKHALFDRSLLKTTDGKPVDIIHSGWHNVDAGPDFFNAQLRIGDTLWAGNVEVHIKSSDWLKHRHQEDAAYKNVILHVVWENDKEITLRGGFLLPALELKDLINNDIYGKYEELKTSSKPVPCEMYIERPLPPKGDKGLISPLTLYSWLDRLVAERLERKTNYISTNLVKSINDWEEVFYRLVLRTLGNPLNSEPFERLAGVLPLKILSKHRADILQTEALLLGQAGLLEGDFKDEYVVKLQKEYKYLAHKLNFDIPGNYKQMLKGEWKFMRIRPFQFPTLRLAQFAAIIHKEEHLFRQAMEADTIYDLIKLFSVEPSAYWLNHFQPDKPSNHKTGAIGKSTVEIIIINAVIPTMFIYGRNSGKEEISENALELLHTLKPESNHIIKRWTNMGIAPADAYESQALLQLRKEYCDLRKCVHCAIGHHLFSISAKSV